MAINLIVTNAGRAALVNAANTGTAPVTITQIGLSATAVAPVKTLTALAGEFKRIGGVGGDVVADDTIHVSAIDESTDVYSLRSFALYLADGTMFAIYGQPTPILEKATAAFVGLSIDVVFADIDTALLEFGDTDFLLPQATTEFRGTVELATTAETQTGTDTVRALTPKGASDVYAKKTGAVFTGNVSAAGTGEASLTTNGDVIAFRAGGVTGVIYLNSTGTRYLYNDGTRYNMWGQPLEVGGAITSNGNTVWHAGNDGSGSGLDADLLDGIDSSAMMAYRGSVSYLAADTATLNGFYTENFPDHSKSLLTFNAGGSVGPTQIQFSHAGLMWWRSKIDSAFWQPWTTIWTSASDGAGSGLDADLLDGLQAADFLRRANGSRKLDYDDFGGFLSIQADPGGWATVFGFKGSAGTPLGGFGAQGGGNTLGYFFMGTAYNAPYVLKVLANSITYNDGAVWHAGNDGSGSGLDADLLDGLQGAAYAKLSQFTWGGNSDGQWRKGPDGFTEQWGGYIGGIGEGSFTQAFPVPFTSPASVCVLITPINSTADGSKDFFAQLVTVAPDGASFTGFMQASNITAALINGYHWRAIGF